MGSCPSLKVPSIFSRVRHGCGCLPSRSGRDLEARSRDLAGHPHDVLRAPETGLVMLRGRMGADGAAFNLGEATVTRCAVRLATGEEGHAYVLGRNADTRRRPRSAMR